MLKSFVDSLLSPLGLQLVRSGVSLHDIDAEARQILDEILPFTMTKNCPERAFSLIEAVRYVVSSGIPGAIVETGVWRGGSMMAVARTLLSLGVQDRDLYLFDTYEGMPAPTKEDLDWKGRGASLKFQKTVREGGSNWCYASLDDVKQNLYSTGYDPRRIHFIQGKVQDTIPENAPDQIAILRLDTDWYESSRHELIHLFPRLERQGVLLLDDYGHWQGVRKAVDEYFQESGQRIFLSRIDRGARIAIKTA